MRNREVSVPRRFDCIAGTDEDEILNTRIILERQDGELHAKKIVLNCDDLHIFSSSRNSNIRNSYLKKRMHNFSLLSIVY